ncbi:MAG: hypothetical protein MUF54_17705 [Polyangiaceae bacterium]|jgi:hypothetical protein|nr:hypothetical protein [Polyangiaceae bacterium]
MSAVDAPPGFKVSPPDAIQNHVAVIVGALGAGCAVVPAIAQAHWAEAVIHQVPGAPAILALSFAVTGAVVVAFAIGAKTPARAAVRSAIGGVVAGLFGVVVVFCLLALLPSLVVPDAPSNSTLSGLLLGLLAAVYFAPLGCSVGLLFGVFLAIPSACGVYQKQASAEFADQLMIVAGGLIFAVAASATCVHAALVPPWLTTGIGVLGAMIAAWGGARFAARRLWLRAVRRNEVPGWLIVRGRAPDQLPRLSVSCASEFDGVLVRTEGACRVQVAGVPFCTRGWIQAVRTALLGRHENDEGATDQSSDAHRVRLAGDRMRKRLIVLALLLLGSVAALAFATGEAGTGAQAGIVMAVALFGAVQVLALGFTCPRCGAPLGGNNPWADLNSELSCHQCGLSEGKSVAEQCSSSAAGCLPGLLSGSSSSLTGHP